MSAAGMDKALTSIMKWAQREPWRRRCNQTVFDHLAAACDDYDIGPDDLSREIGSEAGAIAFSCAFDDFLTRNFEPDDEDFERDDENVIDEYLKRRGWKESVPAKRFLQAMRKSIISLYEVTDTAPGSHLFLRDLVRGGDPIRIEDRVGSETAARWDRLAARVLHVHGRNYLSPGILLFSMDSAEGLLGMIRERLQEIDQRIREILVEPEGEEDEDLDSDFLLPVILNKIGPAITRDWLRDRLEAARRPLPSLSNFDGDALVFAKVRFPVAEANLAEVEALLDGTAGLDRDDGDARKWKWTAEKGPGSRTARSRERGRRGLSVGSLDDRDHTTLGTVELQGCQLILSANSRERVERGTELLSGRLGGLTGAPLTSFQSAESVLQDLGDRPEEPDPAAEIPPEIAARIIHEHLDRHYRQTLEDKLPVLDDRTPLQAARSESGRAKLVDWLKLLENGDMRRARAQNQEPYDFRWMWEELGISELRQ